MFCDRALLSSLPPVGLPSARLKLHLPVHLGPGLPPHQLGPRVCGVCVAALAGHTLKLKFSIYAKVI